jgi:signal transduction histidine kinase
MGELIAGLLEGERLAAGHAALHRVAVDPDALVRTLVAEQFADLPLTLELHAGPAPVALDVLRVKLLLRNLLENARRHAAGAASPAELATARVGDQLLIVLRDHGPGVAAAALPRLAEPFYRPDAARQRATGGVGLGLYLCRRVAEAHGGTLAFAHAAPGLQVTVRLPVPK